MLKVYLDTTLRPCNLITLYSCILMSLQSYDLNFSLSCILKDLDPG
jgi:hypothetical protein